MKIPRHHSTLRRKNERGFIVIAVLVILSILVLYAMVNMRQLNDLKRELQLFEMEQIKRLEKRTMKPTLGITITNPFPNQAVLGKAPDSTSPSYPSN